MVRGVGRRGGRGWVGGIAVRVVFEVVGVEVVGVEVVGVEVEKEVRVVFEVVGAELETAELETQTQVALALEALTYSPHHQTLQTERHHQQPLARMEPVPHFS